MCTECNEDKTQQYNKSRKRRYEMLNTAGATLPNERVATCSKHVPKFGIASILGGIQISINTFGRAQYSGINVCGSVWVCPVCAERIGSYRADEVSIAIAEHVKAGGWALFLTLTHSHKKQDKLTDLLKAEAKAQNAMRNSRPFKDIMKKYGYVGTVKALETLYGKNGWHNHTHEVMFVGDRLSHVEVKEIKDTLYDLWCKYCEKYNIGKPNYQGVDLQVPHSSDSIARYVSKWGYELTHVQMKSGKNGNRTPFNILSDLNEKYTARDYRLFIEYAQAFKGKRQLRWSKGLKKRFGIEEIKDSKLDSLPIKEVITVVQKSDWYKILGANKRAEVLEIAETQGKEGVHAYIEKLIDTMEVIKERKNMLERHTKDKIYLNTDIQSRLLQFPQLTINSQDLMSQLQQGHLRDIKNLRRNELRIESLYAFNKVATMSAKTIRF